MDTIQLAVRTDQLQPSCNVIGWPESEAGLNVTTVGPCTLNLPP